MSQYTSHNHLRDRSALLGTATPTRSASPSADSQFGSQRFADDLEGQNDEMIEGLSAKVKILKEITVGIGNEVRDSTLQLTQMTDAFGETSDILSGTFRRMQHVADRHGCHWLWHIVFLVLVLWFFVVVWWLRR